MPKKKRSPVSEAAAMLGRLGGSVSSPRKTAAVKRNAKLGGRPPKKGGKRVR
jgi:hypothetical protein